MRVRPMIVVAVLGIIQATPALAGLGGWINFPFWEPILFILVAVIAYYLGRNSRR
jgi:hypothetical protein